MRALVIGGGVAGLCAAANLVDHDIDVQLVEATRLLGGRASSWRDEDGDTVDNALHVFFPHYVNCLGFMSKVGAEPLRWTKGMSIYDDAGRRGDLPMGGGPADLARAFNFSTMSRLDQASISYAVLAASLMSDEQLEKADEITLLEWFKLHGMTRTAIDHFRPFGAGLTFLELNHVSAKTLIYWIRSVQCKEMFARPGIGFANGGLGDIYVDKAREYIEKAGGEVVLGRRARSIVVENNRVAGVVMEDGDTMEADVYVSALPYYVLRGILPESSLDYKFFQYLWHIDDAPSVSVQIWFDRFVTEMEYIAAQMRGIFNCFADLHTIVPRFAEEAEGSMVEFVLTPAFHLMSLPDEFIFRTTLGEFERIMPAARQAEVSKWRVVKERQGVFAQRPGTDGYRPSQRTPYINLYLCGDYTRTFISAGMENACASACLAVGHILEDCLDIKKELFSKPVYFTPYIRSGLAAAAGLALSCAVLRSLGKRFAGKDSD
ncbi:MAG: FAD-dependent oxidoreductase [Actinomycetota bacterium]|nr:FAD-dependent oxidoreductase [Actinomycetota bacterium]